MHFCVQTPRGDQDAQAIRVLHLSLNAPVIAIAELPVGPARAGIALCEDSAGDLDLRIAVRSLRTAQVVEYVPVGGSEEAGDLAVDAALSFVEEMGFLCDEDEVASRGAGGADAVAALWRGLVEGVPERLATRATAADIAEAAPAQEPEPALDVPVVVAGSQGEAVNVETAHQIVAAPAVANPAAVLSKFRILRGSIAAPAQSVDAADATDATDAGGEPVVASVDPQDSRIRLLSRF